MYLKIHPNLRKLVLYISHYLISSKLETADELEHNINFGMLRWVLRLQIRLREKVYMLNDLCYYGTCMVSSRGFSYFPCNLILKNPLLRSASTIFKGSNETPMYFCKYSYGCSDKLTRFSHYQQEKHRRMWLIVTVTFENRGGGREKQF